MTCDVRLDKWPSQLLICRAILLIFGISSVDILSKTALYLKKQNTLTESDVTCFQVVRKFFVQNYYDYKIMTIVII